MSNTTKTHVDKIIIRESTLSDANDVAAIHVKSWEQSYRSIIDEHYLQNISFSDRLELRNKILQSNDPNQIHLVAVYEETIIGFCDAGSAFEGTANYRGEIYAIYLLEEFKKLGVGQRLLQAAHEFLAQKKLLPYVAWVLKANHSACAFYQRNGGIVSGEKIEEIGSEPHTEVAYLFGSSINIRKSQLSDIDAMVLLSKAKRLAYEKAQPQFWRYAFDAGDNTQRQRFKGLLEDKNHVMFTAVANCHPRKNGDPVLDSRIRGNDIIGFIIGKRIAAPEVYNPGGLMIDDFCVNCENLWQSVGHELIEETKAAAKDKGATQILVVCGAHDHPKRKFLSEQNLSIASEWFVGGIV
jgi:GNAT superfamily N-acetyltransferase